VALKVLRGVGIPPAGLIERFHGPMRSVALTWRDVSKVVPVEITSWWRDPTRNASTPGAETYSQHLVGTAMDGRSPGRTRAQLLPIVQKAALRYGATVPSKASESSGSSVHVQALPVGTVKALLTRTPALVQSALAFIGPARPIVASVAAPTLALPPPVAASTRQPGGGFNTGY